MPRFFAQSAPENGVFVISGDDARHIALSLRSAVGDAVTVCCDGASFECSLSSIAPTRVEARVVRELCERRELPFEVTLFAANPKAGKLDLVVQKATELGASVIVPFLSERCVSRPDADSAGKRRRRLEKIALESAMQSCREVVPKIEDTVSFADAVTMAARADIALFAYEEERGGVQMRAAVADRLKSARTVSVMTGPEGGFSPDEARLASDAGMTVCGLGRRILRCETAPLYMLSALGYEAGT